MGPLLFALLLFASLMAWITYRSFVRKVTVPDSYAGLLFTKGVYVRTLPSGQHTLIGLNHRLEQVDLRERVELLAGQEVVSSDGAPVKISFVLQYRVQDPYLFRSNSTDARQSIHLLAQAALRDSIASREMESVLPARAEIAEELKPRVAAAMQRYGLRLEDLFIRDLMLAGPLRSVFTRVLAAKREGQIALEKARAESAAIRNLLNTAKLLERNPQLMQLRLLQAMKDSTGNTFILKLPAAPEVAAMAEDAVELELGGNE
ncbi:slipin family protein [bacterium]|nr:slipin family protein [bacterium]